MKDKVVIITGGTSGIGKACAIHFGKNGSKVVITGRTQSSLDATEKELRLLNIDVFPLKADVSTIEDCKRVIERTMNRYERIDILINNAGITMRACLADVDIDVIKQVMDINFYGTVYMTRFAIKEITKNKGSVIAISSIAGKKGLPARTGYSASKFAMEGFMESLRTELLMKDVHVLVACPGFTTSNIRNSALRADGSIQGESPRDEQKMMSSEEVAKHIYNATVNRKRDLVLTTQGKMTVLLNKFFPSLMDKIVYNHMSKEEDSPF